MSLADFDALWDYDQPAATEARFRARLLELAGQPALQIELQTQIARAQGLQRQFDAAHHTLDEVEQALTPGLMRGQIRYHLERGRVFNSAGQPEQARPHFQTAWEQARATGRDDLAVDAAHMLAIVAPPAEQEAWNWQALALAERSADPAARHWLGALCNNLGWTYHGQGDFARALELFERAVAFRAEQGQPRETRIARWCVARTLRSLTQFEAALQQQQALLLEAEAAGAPDGFISEEVGENLLALGRPAEARPHFAAAHRLLTPDPWLAAHEPARLERLRVLSQSPV